MPLVILIGMLISASCVHQEETDWIRGSSWRYCSLEEGALGFYGQGVSFKASGVMQVETQTFEDPGCLSPSGLKVVQELGYRVQAVSSEEVILQVERGGQKRELRVPLINGYLYFPPLQTILMTATPVIDFNQPFSQDRSLPAH